MIPPIPPEPPEPEVTYNITADIQYVSPSASGVDYTLALSYRAEYDSEWVPIDSAVLTSQATGGTSTVVLRNIPQGCHSVKLAISTSSTSYRINMKTRNSSDWGTEISYGSGNDGWDQDYQTDLDIRMMVD